MSTPSVVPVPDAPALEGKYVVAANDFTPASASSVFDRDVAIAVNGGDRLFVLDALPNGLVKVVCRDRMGVVPASCLSTDTSPEDEPIEFAEALFGYREEGLSGENGERDFSFEKGEYMLCLGESSDDLLRVNFAGRTGIVPSTNVRRGIVTMESYPTSRLRRWLKESRGVLPRSMSRENSRDGRSAGAQPPPSRSFSPNASFAAGSAAPATSPARRFGREASTERSPLVPMLPRWGSSPPLILQDSFQRNTAARISGLSPDGDRSPAPESAEFPARRQSDPDLPALPVEPSPPNRALFSAVNARAKAVIAEELSSALQRLEAGAGKKEPAVAEELTEALHQLEELLGSSPPMSRRSSQPDATGRRGSGSVLARARSSDAAVASRRASIPAAAPASEPPERDDSSDAGSADSSHDGVALPTTPSARTTSAPVLVISRVLSDRSEGLSSSAPPDLTSPLRRGSDSDDADPRSSGRPDILASPLSAVPSPAAASDLGTRPRVASAADAEPRRMSPVRPRVASSADVRPPPAAARANPPSPSQDEAPSPELPRPGASSPPQPRSRSTSSPDLPRFAGDGPSAAHDAASASRSPRSQRVRIRSNLASSVDEAALPPRPSGSELLLPSRAALAPSDSGARPLVGSKSTADLRNHRPRSRSSGSPLVNSKSAVDIVDKTLAALVGGDSPTAFLLDDSSGSRTAQATTPAPSLSSSLGLPLDESLLAGISASAAIFDTRSAMLKTSASAVLPSSTPEGSPRTPRGTGSPGQISRSASSARKVARILGLSRDSVTVKSDKPEFDTSTTPRQDYSVLVVKAPRMSRSQSAAAAMLGPQRWSEDEDEPAPPSLRGPERSPSRVDSSFFDTPRKELARWTKPVEFPPDYLFAGPESPSNIVFSREETRDDYPVVAAGTLVKLIQRLTWHDHVDPDFLPIFLLTYCNFTTSHEVLRLLALRFDVPVPADIAANENDNEEFQRLYIKPVRNRIFTVLFRWIEDHWYYFEADPSLVDSLRKFLDGPLQAAMPSTYLILNKVLQRKLSGVATNTQTPVGIRVPPPHQPDPRNLHSLPSRLQFLGFHPEEVARQLTLLEFALFRAIKPTECFDQAWTKSDKETRSPNILAMVERFNKVTSWVSGSVLSIESLRQRAEAVTRFIDIGAHLRAMNNYNGTMAVIAGLLSSPVHRLKKTWAQVSSAKTKLFDDLVELMSPTLNYKNFRMALHDESQPPCIPYLGVPLNDLLFGDEGNPNFVTEHNLINFEKWRTMASTIQSMRQYQHTGYYFQEVGIIQGYLLAAGEYVDEKKCYTISLQLEPRDSEADKRRSIKTPWRMSFGVGRTKKLGAPNVQPDSLQSPRSSISAPASVLPAGVEVTPELLASRPLPSDIDLGYLLGLISEGNHGEKRLSEYLDARRFSPYDQETIRLHLDNALQSLAPAISSSGGARRDGRRSTVLLQEPIKRPPSSPELRVSAPELRAASPAAESSDASRRAPLSASSPDPLSPNGSPARRLSRLSLSSSDLASPMPSQSPPPVSSLASRSFSSMDEFLSQPTRPVEGAQPPRPRFEPDWDEVVAMVAGDDTTAYVAYCAENIVGPADAQSVWQQATQLYSQDLARRDVRRSSGQGAGLVEGSSPVGSPSRPSAAAVAAASAPVALNMSGGGADADDAREKRERKGKKEKDGRERKEKKEKKEKKLKKEQSQRQRPGSRDRSPRDGSSETSPRGPSPIPSAADERRQ